MNEGTSRLDQQPSYYQSSGWQGSDELHPPGDGAPAYRVVFKTLKVAFEAQEVRGPNFVIRFAHGNVQRGGMTLGGAMPGRSFNQAILASEALFRTSADGVFVDFRPVGDYEFNGWEDTVDNVFYAEFILATEATSAQGRIAEGQRRLASLKSMIDLRFGTRVLGVPLTEEVGELFGDGHFNRQIHSGELGGEHELDPHEISAADLMAAFDAHAAIRDGLGGKARRAFDVACEWYWTSIHEDDPVVAYIGLHVALEAVVGTQKHAARELSRVTGKDEACCRQSLTEYKRHRNALVHGARGGARDIEKGYLTSMRVVVEALLSDRLGVLDDARTKLAAQAMDLRLT
ncbi:MAG: hypothetical protein JWM90_1200 [Thermoleophilia bacterium]|nr:hypothetical protein [Thermoleophilia bacterium]